jgi:hypothetical protein
MAATAGALVDFTAKPENFGNLPGVPVQWPSEWIWDLGRLIARHGCHDNGSGGTPGFGASSASVTVEGYRALLSRSLHAETVEFSVIYASEECAPFVRRESENGPFGFPAVTDPDLAAG